MATYGGGPEAPRMINILELTHRLWKEGRFKLDPAVITDRVTYHDPCNVARSGWIVKQPREIIRAFCKDFVEMEPHGENNLCCNGGEVRHRALCQLQEAIAGSDRRPPDRDGGRRPPRPAVQGVRHRMKAEEKTSCSNS
jgi:hypothetical protein